jgi:GT2 family glycosyltransferase
MELIIVDGCSTDRTKDIAEELLRTNCRCLWRSFINPRKTLASGWNIAIRASKGRHIIRIEAHGAIPEDFITANLRALQACPTAAAVGGILRTPPQEGFRLALSKVMTSRFGVGNSGFRTGTGGGETDSLWQALYRREVFDVLGGFDESLPRHQDNEFHTRMRKAGMKLHLDPSIHSTYYGRDTLNQTLRQMFSNGRVWGEMIVRGKHQALSPRHLVPFVFLSILFLLLGAATFSTHARLGLILVLTAHMMGGTAAALRDRGGLPLRWVVLFPPIFLSVHLSYGLGTLAGLLTPLHEFVAGREPAL